MSNVSRGRKRVKDMFEPQDTPNKIAAILALPTSTDGVFTTEQLAAYALNYRILEITQKLKNNDLVPHERFRSPSPPPKYDQEGKRIDTREVRYRNKLEAERHQLIQKAIRAIPNYESPSDYLPPRKTEEKVYIPANDYPEVNFIGLLLGPRGKTLQKMVQESGAKISIRGKGSMKQGKDGNANTAHAQSLNEELHCLITAESEEKIEKAVKMVNEIIETAASTPESQNSLKRGQLRDLAVINGTYNDWAMHPCANCGELGHRSFECPNQSNYTVSVVCRICGNKGHLAKDCKENRRQNGENRSFADREYEQLMIDLGHGPTASSGISTGNERPAAIENSNGDRDRDRSNNHYDNQHRDNNRRNRTEPDIPWASNQRQSYGGSSGGGGRHGYNNQSASGANSIPTGPSRRQPFRQDHGRQYNNNNRPSMPFPQNGPQNGYENSQGLPDMPFGMPPFVPTGVMPIMPNGVPAMPMGFPSMPSAAPPAVPSAPGLSGVPGIPGMNPSGAGAPPPPGSFAPPPPPPPPSGSAPPPPGGPPSSS